MHTALIAVVLAIAVASAPVAAPAMRAAPSSQEGQLHLHDAWMSPARAGGTASLYLHFENKSDQSLVVTRATTEVARGVQGNALATEGPERSPYSSGFVIAAHGRLRMGPDGPHLILSGITRDLRPGDQVPLALHCPDGLTLTIMVVVRTARG